MRRLGPTRFLLGDVEAQKKAAREEVWSARHDTLRLLEDI